MGAYLPGPVTSQAGYIPLACRELIARLDTLFLGENLVTQHVTQHANDKLEVEPTLKALEQLPETLGKAEALLADTGHRSESNTKACDAAKITPTLLAHARTIIRQWKRVLPNHPRWLRMRMSSKRWTTAWPP